MSKEITNLTAVNNKDVSVDQFSGGERRGRCLQLTQMERGHGKVIQLTREQVEQLVEAAQEWLGSGVTCQYWGKDSCVNDAVEMMHSVPICGRCLSKVRRMDAENGTPPRRGEIDHMAVGVFGDAAVDAGIHLRKEHE